MIELIMTDLSCKLYFETEYFVSSKLVLVLVVTELVSLEFHCLGFLVIICGLLGTTEI